MVASPLADIEAAGSIGRKVPKAVKEQAKKNPARANHSGVVFEGQR